MRKIVVTTFLSLDGVMQAPGGPEEDDSNGFTQGGWAFHYWDNVMDQEMGEFLTPPFDLLFGRKTYQILGAFWPNAPEEMNPGPLNNATKYVVSTTLTRGDWQPAVVIGTDVVERITSLKQEDGPEIQVHGSGNLIQTLIANDLVDEYHLMIFPVLLGKGKRLFADGVVPAGLRLVSTKTAGSGVIIATYERAGDITYGTFAPDDSNAA